ncbi:MAG: hypothetical protein BWK79_10160 [Beggiatoa sp. IS2]|nr:MAG: hypothetical protein BWK79_10160 [Beggiatoa sp. IS2]
MFSQLKYFSIILSIVLLANCATTGGLNYSNFLKVKDGMSQEEVIDILGEPTDITSVNLSTGGLGSLFGLGDVSGTNMIWAVGGAKANVIFVGNKVKSSNFTTQF